MIENLRNILVTVLSVDADQVNEDSNLIRDLAAESLDFVDIAFQIEKEFGLKNVDPTGIFPAFLREEREVFEGDKLSAHVRERLASEYPFLSARTLERFEASRSYEVFFDVSVLLDFVRARKAEAA